MGRILGHSILSLKNNCIGYFPLNGNANDSIGNYTPTDTNPVYTIGRNKQARDYNGLGTNPITVVKTNATYSNFSISLWFNARNLGSYKGILGGSPFLVYLGGGTIQLLWSAGGYVTKFWSFTQVVNVWYHLIITFDGSLANDDRIKVYINGTILDDITFPTVPTTFDLGTTTIGADGFGYHYDGKIDEIGVFNKTLTQSEINILYSGSVYPFYRVLGNKPTQNANGLVAHWKFENNMNDEMGTYNGTQSNAYTPTYAKGIGMRGKGMFCPYPIHGMYFTPIILTNFTLSFWYKHTTELNCQICGKYIDSSKFRGFSSILGNSIYFDFGMTGATSVYSQLLNRNVWYHIVFTVNVGVGTLYVNGKLSTNVYTGTGFTGIEMDRVGYFGYGSEGGNAFDEFKVFNRAITDAEVEKEYKYPFYKLDENIDLTTGLIYGSKFDSNSNDVLGIRNGTDTAMSYVAGVNGNCASFNGTSSKIDLPSAITLTGDFTVSFWIKPPSENATWGPVIGPTISSIGGIYYYNYAPYRGVFNVSGNVLTAGNYGNELVANVWSHICITRVNTKIRIYVNNISNGQDGVITGSITYNLMGYTPAYNSYINVLIDDIYIHNRALNTIERDLISKITHPFKT